MGQTVQSKGALFSHPSLVLLKFSEVGEPVEKIYYTKHRFLGPILLHREM
jgi:hypothetical protein